MEEKTERIFAKIKNKIFSKILEIFSLEVNLQIQAEIKA